jgi:hypothetical protein
MKFSHAKATLLLFAYLSALLVVTLSENGQATEKADKPQKKDLKDLFCGSTPVFGDVDPIAMNNLLDFQSNAKMLGKKIVPCNLPGDSFQVCRACNDEITPEQMDVIRPMMASREHRAWHGQWHFSFEGPLIQHKGESFLYMHRQMLKMVNLELTASGLACISSWAAVPPPDDKAWPAPVIAQTPGDESLLESMRENHNEILSAVRTISTTEYLRSHTLEQLGVEINGNLHRLLHLFYEDSEEVVNEKCQGDERLSPTCDKLDSNLSAHVNRYFWKFHPYVDDFIYKWLQANDYDKIAVDCQDEKRCYQWVGTEVGPPPSQIYLPRLEK